MDTLLFWADVTFELYEDTMVSGKFIFIFCLEPTIRKDTWMNTTSVTVMFFFFSKVPFFKLLDRSYVQSPFSVITRHVHNCVLKGSLQLIILRIWINICEFCHQDLGKDHETKVDEGNRQIISCTKIRACTSKNIVPKKITFHLFFYAFISLKQT